MADSKPVVAEREAKIRFAAVSEEGLNQILDRKDALNTKKATDHAVRLLRIYLREKGQDENFECLPADSLDKLLSKFYLEVRNAVGELYKKSSLQAIRHGLNRYMDSKGTEILKNSDFTESNKVYSAMTKELKRQGVGGIKHYPPIEQNDLTKMYQSFDLQDPVSQQQKVFTDIMLYFGRRGRENLRLLKVSDFALTSDADGRRYIYLVSDELTINHQNDTNTADGRMYAIDDDDLCPVRSFLLYRRKLAKGYPYPFQRPSRKIKDHQWYDKMSLGHNKLGAMMADISERAGLSQRYTNHSLRATTVHVLDAAQIPGRHIMTVTGHKSESSLKTYTGYTDN